MPTAAPISQSESLSTGTSTLADAYTVISTNTVESKPKDDDLDEKGG